MINQPNKWQIKKGVVFIYLSNTVRSHDINIENNYGKYFLTLEAINTSMSLISPEIK